MGAERGERPGERLAEPQRTPRGDAALGLAPTEHAPAGIGPLADARPGAARELPGAVLFACTMNAVRSPMAAGILRHLAGRRAWVESAGIRSGAHDAFVDEVMSEIGIDLRQHTPRTLSELDDTSFDVIVSLSPEAHHQALELTRTFAVEVEYWPTFDPSLMVGSGSREQVLDAYRAVRDGLFRRIKQRFGLAGGPSV